MYDLNKLGNNIRCLRIAYGESQEALGQIIGVEKSAVSMYETGRREPNKDMLRSIAEHYGASVEELLTEDLTEMGNARISVNPYVFWEEIDVVLPITASEDALKNPHFKKAHTIHRALFDEFQRYAIERKGTLNAIDEIDVCIEEYLAAYEDEQSKEVSAANLLGLWFCFLALTRNGQRAIEKKPAALTQLMKKDKKLEREVEKMESKVPDEEIEEIVSYFLSEEIRENIIEFLTVLKQSELWPNLADYYLALQYCWNLVDNALDHELNSRIGAEMQEAFALVGNPYSAHFFVYQKRSLGWEEQVDKS